MHRNQSALYLVRHGETAWNSAGRFQGALDSPLTDRGRQQALAVAHGLAARLKGSSQPLRAYVSPLGRTRETAAIIARLTPLDIQPEPRIAEVSLGVWDGMSMYEIEMEYPCALSGTDRHDWYFRAPGGESFEAAFARVSSWLNEVTTPAIAVTHGLASRLVRGAYEGLSKPEMLRLAVPQDGFYRLCAGRSEFVDCA